MYLFLRQGWKIIAKVDVNAKNHISSMYYHTGVGFVVINEQCKGASCVKRWTHFDFSLRKRAESKDS